MSAQEQFDRTYISSSEISRRLNVTRNAVILARSRGLLPDEIMVEGQLTLWNREHIEPYLQAWEERRKARLGV